MSQGVKNATSCNVEQSFKTFQDPDPEEGEFQNLMGISLSADTSVVKF